MLTLVDDDDATEHLFKFKLHEVMPYLDNVLIIAYIFTIVLQS